MVNIIATKPLDILGVPEVHPGPGCISVAGEPLRSPDLLPGDEAAVASLDLGGHLLLLRRGHRPRQVQPPPRDPVADEGARAETRDVHLLMVAVLLSDLGQEGIKLKLPPLLRRL